MEFQSRYALLNPAQRHAVDQIDGPVMVIAGPGTGKTELLGVRVGNILRKTDTLPENILCLTFTDSGGDAMRRRLVDIIGPAGYKVAVHTFHSFGVEVINQHREHFYGGMQFQLADELMTYQILRDIFDSLPHASSIRSQKNGEFAYLNDAKKVISELKRSGLTSDELLGILTDNDAALDAIEPLIRDVFSGTVSKKTADALAVVLDKLGTSEVLLDHNLTPPLYAVITDSLRSAYDASQSVHPTKPLSAWKAAWLKKDDSGQLIFKTRTRQKVLRELAYVYYEYLNRFDQAGLYDYDDMILQVVHALEISDELRFNLQEKYQYIMIDEFQDTNLAQMRILRSLTDNPVNEGNPNLLIVGDDDQAIYSFQGADVSNILTFQQTYPTARLITLTDNYRSNATVLQSARNIIMQGNERLETMISGLDKNLSAHKETLGRASLSEASSVSSERLWLADQVADLIKSGTLPSDIAVITRRHSDIEKLLPYFFNNDVVVNYERRDNVLELAPIMALERIARVVLALSNGQHDVADGLLPELLAHPAWGIDAKDMWRLSVKSYDERTRWMNLMEKTPRFAPVHDLLIDLATRASVTPLEPMIDRLIGHVDSEVADSECAELPVSPLFGHYFSDLARQNEPGNYLRYIQALRALRRALRTHQPNGTLTLQSMIDCIDLYDRLQTPITSIQEEAADRADAIHLMTAHKSKGLEFDTVFVAHAVDSIWGEKARSGQRLISYPENLPIGPVGDNIDERLRLFYVALTRAKQNLYISYAATDDGGKPQLPASFLVDNVLPIEMIEPNTGDVSLIAAETDWYQRFTQPTQDLTTTLAPYLSKYKLSATHLNAFTDVTHGGPQAFLVNNLLHFPSSMSAAAQYGSAIHRTLQQVHIFLGSNHKRKPIEDILKDFETNLTQQRLDKLNYDFFLQKGSDDLRLFFDSNYDSFTPTQKTELGFAAQESYVDDAHLTGSLDLVDIDRADKTMIVTDYKTGRPITTWKGTTDYEKIKIHKYRQQLLFYKLLVESSRDYGTFTVTAGCLTFVEPTKSSTVAHLQMDFTPDEIERTRQLIAAVWQHVTTLSLPDTSEYDASYKGILAFEQDLIDGIV